ncbi:dihydrofolate reductase-like domain-containing protein [Vararia minispora EC-137]|uniref:Dihydrofolate reductase-like domain-containing protein n=1 Tax=Vararia minispora EC-137 TaxID=1314806 RepID=A0ACB8QKG0_9AGAM|nr:dihydrofolate reductase-like domain-containing protein [Vararia minispora EC-137]
MSSEAESQDPPAFLASVLGRLVSSDPTLPYVTLTFAQSLDAKVAGRGGLQLILSGNESMKMTHWMRTMHEGILIGVGTAVNDNPQLNVRHLPFPAQGGHMQHYHHPRPLVLDPNLRISPKCKLIYNASLKAGETPWIISARPAKTESAVESQDGIDWEARKAALEKTGAKVILIERDPSHMLIPNSDSSSYLSMSAVLRAIRAEGIKSVMVEGGARVILSFLHNAQEGKQLFDSLVVTVAPVIVGAHGVGYSELLDDIPGLEHVRTEALGKDVVFGMKAMR